MGPGKPYGQAAARVPYDPPPPRWLASSYTPGAEGLFPCPRTCTVKDSTTGHCYAGSNPVDDKCYCAAANVYTYCPPPLLPTTMTAPTATVAPSTTAALTTTAAPTTAPTPYSGCTGSSANLAAADCNAWQDLYDSTGGTELGFGIATTTALCDRAICHLVSLPPPPLSLTTAQALHGHLSASPTG
jgi:hypothetical protein